MAQIPSLQWFRLFTSDSGHTQVDNLYDVFVNVRDDEREHVKTMEALQKPEAQPTFHSPHTVFIAAKALPSEGEA